MADPPSSTAERGYTDRLVHKGGAWWKRWFGAQAPYRWNIRRLKPGFVLDIGSGIGRNLAHLDGHGIGVDHNTHSVAVARSRGLTAYTEDSFFACADARPERFDSLLLAHVAEHMTPNEFVKLLKRYLPLLKTEGRVIIITPQERGYRSDPTHVHFFDFQVVSQVAMEVGLQPVSTYSFPLPRWMGGLFAHNEFVSIFAKPGSAASPCADNEM